MAKRLADRKIGPRAVEELHRVFPNLEDNKIAQRLGLERKIISIWKSGGAPSGFALQRMCFEGCDVKYVLTGRKRNSEEIPPND